jgi:hypothetical protein
MSKTLLDLSKDMKKIAGSFKKEASRAAVYVAETILYDLAYKTPVDTSQAISNWQIRLKEPISSGKELEPYYEGEHGTTRNMSAQESIAIGKSKLQRKKPGDSIFISNVLPYIKRLNDGYSSQEPAGMIERAVLLGRNVIKNFKVRIEVV